MSKKEVLLHNSPVYHMLLEKLPTEFIKEGLHEKQPFEVDVTKLSRVMDVSYFTAWRWCMGSHFSRKAIKSLVEISANTEQAEKKGLIKSEDLLPFLLNS